MSRRKPQRLPYMCPACKADAYNVWYDEADSTVSCCCERCGEIILQAKIAPLDEPAPVWVF